MTVPRVALAIPERWYCRAPHPARAGGQRCNSLLGILPGPLRFVGLAPNLVDERDGRVYLRCPRAKCGMWNMYEILPTPLEQQDAG